jgi:endogenous inhibitor of DNA gyrase (YacG/DUF329 family)
MKKQTPLIVRCPTCRRTVDWKTSPERPFCSERCRLIDLGKWSEEAYRIAGEKITREEEENPSSNSSSDF